MRYTYSLILLLITNLCYSQQEINVPVISRGPVLREKANVFIKTHHKLCSNFKYDPSDTIQYEGGRNAKENQYSLLAVNKAKALTISDENDITRFDFRVLIKRIKGEYYVVQMHCPTADSGWKMVWEEYPK